MGVAYFWNLGTGLGLRHVLFGSLFGVAVSVVLFASYVVCGVQSGWRALILFFVAGAIGGLVVGLLSAGRLDGFWSAVAGAVMLPLALLADSGFSIGKIGKH